MSPRKLPERDLVRQLLDYDPAAGVFTWLPQPEDLFNTTRVWRIWNTKYAGKIAGSTTPYGYIVIYIRKQLHMAHRLAWLYVRGEPVPIEMDHIDRDKSNNRIDNLRAATRAQNVANATARKINKLGVRGVHLDERGKYHAQIKTGQALTFLGRFDTLEEAREAYRIAAIARHGVFAAPSP